MDKRKKNLKMNFFYLKRYKEILIKLIDKIKTI